MRATVTVNLPDWAEETELEYEFDDLNAILAKVAKDYPNFTSLVIVVVRE